MIIEIGMPSAQKSTGIVGGISWVKGHEPVFAVQPHDKKTNPKEAVEWCGAWVEYTGLCGRNIAERAVLCLER